MGLENFDDNNTKNFIKEINSKLESLSKEINSKLESLSKKNDLILEGVVNTLREIIKNQSNINNKFLQLQSDLQKNQAYVKDSAILISGIQNDIDDIKSSLSAVDEHLDNVQNDILNIKIFKTVEKL